MTEPGRDRLSILIIVVLCIISLMIIANAIYWNTDHFGFCLVEDGSIIQKSCVEYFGGR